MADRDLVIAHISDVHISGKVPNRSDPHLARLEQIVDHLCAMTRLPDALFVAGDLADHGSEAAYRLVDEQLRRCPFPAHVALGNHDDRAGARAVFGGGDSDFMQYAVDVGEVRVIVIDTLEEGRHGGAFCEARAAWLRGALREAEDRPVLIVMHHAPIDTGLDWMTTSMTEPWLVRLDAALDESDHVVALLAGHIHRPMVALRNRIPVLTCPAINARLVLDLAPLSPERPDGRPLVVDAAPGFALHLWRAGTLRTHFDFLDEQRTVFSFEQAAEPFMRSLFAERSN
jgi:Icc protein